MTSARQFIEKMLEDRKIDESEVAEIEQFIAQDGLLDMEDVKLLVQLYCEADSFPESFEQLFFDVLRAVMTEDQKISASERFYLLKVIYSDRQVRPVEREFLLQLQRDGIDPCPEFDKLLELAQSVDPFE